MIMITPGQWFDTDVKTDCICLTAPDAKGNFLAYNSDRVVCAFNTVMISALLPRVQPPGWAKRQLRIL